MNVKQGMIYQSVSGFYYVWGEDGQEYVTKPRGNFRHQQLKPLVGDNVVFEYDSEDEASHGRIIEVLPRRNQFVRPPIVNVDYAIVVISLVEPEFSYNLLDHFLVSVESKGITPIIVLTKYDLCSQYNGQAQADERVKAIRQTYQLAQYQVIVSTNDTDLTSAIMQNLSQGIHVVMGQSGVGKSTLLNKLLPNANIPTGEISDYLNRGKHTTREVTLYPLNNGYVADTPGFSALELSDLNKYELARFFPDIQTHAPQCKFNSCLHMNEPQCAVKAAVAQQHIAPTRYDNYCQFYERIDNKKPLYKKKGKSS